MPDPLAHEAYPEGTAVGILGDGQLALMLAQAGRRLGLTMTVLAASSDKPVCAVVDHVVVGSVDDPKSLREFCQSVKVVAFENEWVDVAALQAAGPSCDFSPSLGVLEQLQDKRGQHKALERLGIPQPKSILLATEASVDRANLQRQFPEGFVLKWTRLGYDGGGVLLCRAGSACPDESSIREFCQRGFARGAAILVQEMIPFERELAIVASRSRTGELALYPVVVSEQDEGICWRVTGPAEALGVSGSRIEEARQAARSLAEGMPMVGTFAIEFFDAPGRPLLVNEIAPRVHNSGHYTLDAGGVSQFENHWRALLGWPLGAVSDAPAFAMVNLLGPAGRTGKAPVPSAPSSPLHLHWYGKSAIRPRRKMGHLNGSAASTDDLGEVLRAMDTYEQSWKS